MHFSLTLAWLCLVMGASAGPTQQELHDWYMSEEEQMDRVRKECQSGEYFSFATKSCESCDKTYPDAIDSKKYGPECDVYFLKAKLAAQKDLHSLEVAELKNNNKELQKTVQDNFHAYNVITAVVVIVAVAGTFVVIRCSHAIRCSHQPCKKLTNKLCSPCVSRRSLMSNEPDERPMNETNQCYATNDSENEPPRTFSSAEGSSLSNRDNRVEEVIGFLDGQGVESA